MLLIEESKGGGGGGEGGREREREREKIGGRAMGGTHRTERKLGQKGHIKLKFICLVYANRE